MNVAVDQAFDLIEFVALRAAKRGGLSHLKIEANVNLGIAQVGIEVGYGDEELRKLVELKST